MTDHAKDDLADALRQIASCEKRCDGDVVDIARKALAVYDAHPAEAATRENGEIADLLNRLRSPSGIGEPSDHAAMREAAEILAVTDYGYREICKRNDELLAVIQAQTAALSTHQQQGDSERFARLMAALELAGNRLHRCVLDHPVGSREFLERSDWTKDAREALFAAVASRSPQPDTVTEERIKSAAVVIAELRMSLAHSAEDVARAALTAALMARGKT